MRACITAYGLDFCVIPCTYSCMRRQKRRHADRCMHAYVSRSLQRPRHVRMHTAAAVSH